MAIIRALIEVFTAVLRSMTSSILVLISTVLTAVGIVALLGFFGAGLTGAIGLRLSRHARRRTP